MMEPLNNRTASTNIDTAPEPTPRNTSPASSATEVRAEPSSKAERILNRSTEYLMVCDDKQLTKEAKDYILKITLSNFDDYFNKGFLHYRKSVAEAEDFAAILVQNQKKPEPSVLQDHRAPAAGKRASEPASIS